jgi:hypothetical protein
MVRKNKRPPENAEAAIAAEGRAVDEEEHAAVVEASLIEAGESRARQE